MIEPELHNLQAQVVRASVNAAELAEWLVDLLKCRHGFRSELERDQPLCGTASREDFSYRGCGRSSLFQQNFSEHPY